jgi:hypothetical protein
MDEVLEFYLSQEFTFKYVSHTRPKTDLLLLQPEKCLIYLQSALTMDIICATRPEPRLWAEPRMRPEHQHYLCYQTRTQPLGRAEDETRTPTLSVLPDPSQPLGRPEDVARSSTLSVLPDPRRG